MWFVVNRLSRIAIWQAERVSTHQEQGNTERGERVYTSDDDGFHALPDSPLGGCAINALIDHKSQVGYRPVENVIVLGVDPMHDLDDFKRSRSFMIILSEPRS